jgi:hypothetical protein
VSKLRFRISASLDGFVACPNQSLQEPLGIGGEQLHEWVIALAGDARVAQQYLRAGLVDEMQLHLVPALLGGGERLFNNVGATA